MQAIKAARAAAQATVVPSTPPRSLASTVVVAAGSSCEQSPPAPPCVAELSSATGAGTLPSTGAHIPANLSVAAKSPSKADADEAGGQAGNGEADGDAGDMGGCGCGDDDVGTSVAKTQEPTATATAGKGAAEAVPSSVLRDDEPVNPDALMLEFFATRQPPKFVYKRSKRAAAPVPAPAPVTPVPPAEPKVSGAVAATDGDANTTAGAGEVAGTGASDGGEASEHSTTSAAATASHGADSEGGEGDADDGSAPAEAPASGDQTTSADAQGSSPAVPSGVGDEAGNDTPSDQAKPAAAKPTSTAKSRASDADRAGLAEVSTDLLPLAEQVLRRVLSRFGSNARFMRESFGEVIPESEADAVLRSFLKVNRIKGKLSVKWVRGLNAAGKVNYSFNNRAPEKRKFTLWVAHVPENKLQHSSVLRKRGIHSFAYHEIGTHLVRALNDGLQPWAGKWAQYGMRSRRTTRADIQAEEGLASLNTVLPVKHKFLWAPALLYYAAAKAKDMNFVELFDHLEQFEPNKELRWKHCVRAKYLVDDNSQPGGYGRGQAYFEGIVAILRNLNTINLRLLWAGRLNLDDVQQDRINRITRLGLITVPAFCRLREDTEATGGDWGLYRAALREIGVVNGILAPEPRVVRQPSPQRRAPRPTTVPSNAPSMLARAKAASRRRAMIDDAREHVPPPSPIRSEADIQAAVARLSRPSTAAAPPVEVQAPPAKHHRRRRSTSQVRSRSRSRGSHHRGTRSSGSVSKEPPTAPTVDSAAPDTGGSGADATASDADGWPVGAWKPWKPPTAGHGEGNAASTEGGDGDEGGGSCGLPSDVEASDLRSATPATRLSSRSGQHTLASLPEVRLAKRAWTGTGTAPSGSPMSGHARATSATLRGEGGGSHPDPVVLATSGRTRSRSRSGNRRRGRSSQRRSKASSRSSTCTATATDAGPVPKHQQLAADSLQEAVVRTPSVASSVQSDADCDAAQDACSDATPPLTRVATVGSIRSRLSTPPPPSVRRTSPACSESSPTPRAASAAGSVTTPPRSVRTCASSPGSVDGRDASADVAVLRLTTPPLRSGARVPLASPIVPRTTSKQLLRSTAARPVSESPALGHMHAAPGHVGDTLLAQHGSPGAAHRHVVEAAWASTPIRTVQGRKHRRRGASSTPARGTSTPPRSSHRSRASQDTTAPPTPLHRAIPRVNLGLFVDGFPSGAVGMHVTGHGSSGRARNAGALSLVGHSTPLRVRHPPTLEAHGSARGETHLRRKLSRTVTLPQPQYRPVQQQRTYSGVPETLRRVGRVPSGGAWGDQRGADVNRHRGLGTNAGGHRAGFTGSVGVPRSFGHPHHAPRIW